jgi:hypothetical protein
VLRRETRIKTDLAMLHDVELSQPGLIERIAGGMYNMTKSVLFCEDQHRVQKTFHRLGGLDKSRPSIVNDKQNVERS